MSFTFTEHRTDGVTTTFPFRFAGKDKGYLRSSDIAVYLKLNGEWTEALNWALTGTNQITFSTAPAASASVNLQIRRVVPKIDPYAEFARGPALDMRSLNYAFVQNLQVTQELMDGFLPDGFFFKGEVSFGGNKVTNIAPGTELGDAVEYSQLMEQAEWNRRQDIQIEGLKSSLGSDVAHRTIPWYTTASEGQTKLEPPFTFSSALVFVNGLMQYELDGAFSIADSKITMAEPLTLGDKVLVLIGSRIATTEVGVAEVNIDVAEGTTVVNLNIDFGLVTVFLDGLKQPTSAYTIEGRTLRFKEPLPECKLSALAVAAARGGNL
ncbi:tail fiber protein [Pectobacterium phage POP72]|uniref:Tail fiber protein n=2 Tax=Axomammavirus PP1 TaxID=2733578 RepID=A0A2R2V1S0_9CAUD|nr:tail fiber protein [Pectobacterium phage PP1]AFP33702.1 putative tail fiber protein [Pectobacterium phage PP1]ARB10960.1 tail fiber protein [Pectobacterium phage POP72]